MDPYLGQILLVPYNYAPQGWAFCDGQLLSIQQNTALFALLGTTYGGDGRTTFALPDLRGRAPIHEGRGLGLSDYPLGASGGHETVTLLESNLPPHSHFLPAPAAEQTSDRPSANLTPAIGNAYGDPAGTPGRTAATGGGQPFDNRSPYLVMNYIIALEGIFPANS